MQYHTDTIIKTSEDFFIEICTSHFIVRVRKCYSRFYDERELETEQKLQYFDPTLMAVSVVSFSFSRASQPEALGLTLLAFSTTSYSATSLDPNSIGGPEPLRPGVAFLTTSRLYLRPISNCLTSVLTELYNSSTPTRSPTRSLEWHV